MNLELLRDLARHQIWANAEHWKTIHGSRALTEDEEIRKRMNHMVMASEMLQALTRGEAPSAVQDRQSAEELEAAMIHADQALFDLLESVDLERMIALPRGPKGPFTAPAGVLLLQVLTHSQHHRGQNASRMRALGASPPMTDFVFWYAVGRP